MQLQTPKIIFLGDENVGKTSIIRTLTNNPFETSYIPTVSIENNAKNIIIQSKQIRFQIFDCPGKENYRPFLRDHIKNPQIVIIVYDITNIISFNNVNKWYELIKKNESNDFLLILIGNKYDLREKRKVSLQLGKQKSIELDSYFFEISGFESEKITDILNQIGLYILSKKKKIETDIITQENNKEKLRTRTIKNINKSGIRPTTANIYSKSLLFDHNNNDLPLPYSLNLSKLNNSIKKGDIRPNSSKRIKYNFPINSGQKSEPLQAETLYDELNNYKLLYNELKIENTKLRTIINRLEKDHKNLEKYIEELSNIEIYRKNQSLSNLSQADNLTFSLKKQVKDLKDEIKCYKEDLLTMKKSIKYTHFQELEMTKKAFGEENIRLKNILKDIQLKEQDNFVKEQEIANLEKQFYIQNELINKIKKENNDLVETLKLSEQSNQKLREIFENNEIITNINKNQVYNIKNNSDSNQTKEFKFILLQNQLKEKDNEIQLLKQSLKYLKEDKYNNDFPKKTIKLTVNSDPNVSNPLKNNEKNENIPISLFEEIKFKFLCKGISIEKLELELYKEISNILLVTKSDLKEILKNSPFLFNDGNSIDKLSTFLIQNCYSFKLGEILTFIRNRIGNYELEKEIFKINSVEFENENKKKINEKKEILSKMFEKGKIFEISQMQKILEGEEIKLNKTQIQKILISIYKKEDFFKIFNENIDSPDIKSPPIKTNEYSDIFESPNLKDKSFNSPLTLKEESGIL